MGSVIFICVVMKIGFVSSLSGTGVFKDACIVDNLVYCATGRGLEIIDISDYKNPFSVGSCNTPGEGEAVFVSGRYAYVADGTGGIRIIDVFDPNNPTEKGHMEIEGYAIDVAVIDRYAYVASCEGGMNIIDTRFQIPDFRYPPPDIRHPTSDISGECLQGSTIRDIVIVGKYAYIVDYREGLRIMDVSDPVNPCEVGKLKVSGMSIKVAILDTFALLLSDRGMNIINIAEPSEPFLVSFCDEVGEDIAVYNSYVYLISNDGMKVINLANPLEPEVIGGRGNASPLHDIEGQGISVNHFFACVSCLREGLIFLDISEPWRPEIVGKYDPPGQIYDVEVSGNLLYAAKYEDGLEIIDLSTLINDGRDLADINSPTVIGKYDTKGAAWALSTSGVSVKWSGISESQKANIKTYDLNGRLVKTLIPNPLSLNTAKKVDFYVCLADDVGGVWTIDVKDPYKPEKLGYLDTHYTEEARGYARGVCVEGNYAYIADHVGGFLILDISCPSEIIRVSHYQTPAPVWDVCFSSPYCYLAEGEKGVQVIDVSIPSEPKEAGHYDTQGYSWALDIAGNYCYIADGELGLKIIDISQLSEVGYLNTPGCAAGVTVVPPYAYVADGNRGVRVIDVSTPSKPVEIEHYDTPGYARRVAVLYPYIFVADSEGGVVILSVSDPPANPPQAEKRRAGKLVF